MPVKLLMRIGVCGRVQARIVLGYAVGALGQSRQSTGSGYWAEYWDRDMGLHNEDSILSADHTANRAVTNMGFPG